MSTCSGAAVSFELTKFFLPLQWAFDFIKRSEQFFYAADAVLRSLSVKKVVLRTGRSFQLTKSTHTEPLLLFRSEPVQVYIFEIY